MSWFTTYYNNCKYDNVDDGYCSNCREYVWDFCEKCKNFTQINNYWSEGENCSRCEDSICIIQQVVATWIDLPKTKDGRLGIALRIGITIEK